MEVLARVVVAVTEKEVEDSRLATWRLYTGP